MKKLKSLLVPEWHCAVRFNENENTFLIDGGNEKFTLIKDSYRYWTADPFLVKNGGKYYLFFEAFDRLKRKGVLGFREIEKNRIGKINIIYETDSHMSYPFIYKENETFYMIPESKESGELFRLKSTDFPYKWEKDTVFSNKPLVDTTMLDYQETRYYVSEIVNVSGFFNRVDLFYEENGAFKECKNNPVIDDVNTARCAGKLFEYNGLLIRPSQNCGKSYGEKLNFNQVIDISKDGYREKLIKCISVSDININSSAKFVGIHTYNRLDNIEVIDLKTAGSFNLLNYIGALFKRFKRLVKRG
ncbi:MAG: hypothetical protein ACI4XC_05360 [Eubacterium sp.]